MILWDGDSPRGAVMAGVRGQSCCCPRPISIQRKHPPLPTRAPTGYCPGPCGAAPQVCAYPERGEGPAAPITLAHTDPRRPGRVRVEVGPVAFTALRGFRSGVTTLAGPGGLSLKTRHRRLGTFPHLGLQTPWTQSFGNKNPGRAHCPHPCQRKQDDERQPLPEAATES